MPLFSANIPPALCALVNLWLLIRNWCYSIDWLSPVSECQLFFILILWGWVQTPELSLADRLGFLGCGEGCVELQPLVDCSVRLKSHSAVFAFLSRSFGKYLCLLHFTGERSPVLSELPSLPLWSRAWAVNCVLVSVVTISIHSINPCFPPVFYRQPDASPTAGEPIRIQFPSCLEPVTNATGKRWVSGHPQQSHWTQGGWGCSPTQIVFLVKWTQAFM